jgi:hypothetical protein
LRQRPFDRPVGERDERCGVSRRRARIALRLQIGELRRGKRLAACVGKKSIEAAAQVLDVKADGGGAVRRAPEMFDRQRGQRGADVFAGLEQGVGNRLQKRRDARDRAAQPVFGFSHRRGLSPRRSSCPPH